MSQKGKRYDRFHGQGRDFQKHGSKELKQLSKDTNHGFSEFKDLQDLNEYFMSDPDSVGAYDTEPPIFFKKPSREQLARSKGTR